LSTVKRDADNATAAGFRSARACAITGHRHARGALVEPLLTPGGCAGVLAIELNDGRAPTRSARAVATIIAAQLSQLLGGASPAQVHAHADERVSSTDSFMPPILVAGGRR
jgi:GAF domain-containing protein